jgi:hypothetical protein
MNPYKITLFLAAISQIASTFFTNFSGGSRFNELLITPAGYTFSIWGVIITLSSIYAAWHLFVDTHTLRAKVYVALSLVYVCYTAWLIAAERELFALTVLIVVAMYGLLASVMGDVYKERKRNAWNKVFLWGGAGMYLGWVSIATVLNIGIYIFSLGYENVSTTGMYLQMGLVILTTISAGFALVVSRYNLVTFGTHWWAFVGLLIGLWGRENTSALIVVTLVCVVTLNAFFFSMYRRIR